MTDDFWLKNPAVLISPNAIFEIIPSSAQPPAERFNSAARLIIAVALVAALLLKKGWPLLVAAGGLVLTKLLYDGSVQPEPAPLNQPVQWEFAQPQALVHNLAEVQSFPEQPIFPNIQPSEAEPVSSELPLDFGYTLGSGLPIDGGTVGGRATRPIANAGSNLVYRPTSLHFHAQPYRAQQAPSKQAPAQQGPPEQAAPQPSNIPNYYPNSDPYSPRVEPGSKPWAQMNQVEQMNYLAHQRRDGFINNIFAGIDHGINQRQFTNLNAFNIADRDRAVQFIWNGPEVTHFKDKYSYWQQKYKN
jgi:hypothetical protein